MPLAVGSIFSPDPERKSACLRSGGFAYDASQTMRLNFQRHPILAAKMKTPVFSVTYAAPCERKFVKRT